MENQSSTSSESKGGMVFISSLDIEMIELIGQGTFGQVFKARIKKTGEYVAVKRVFQDPKYKNR